MAPHHSKGEYFMKSKALYIPLPLFTAALLLMLLFGPLGTSSPARAENPLPHLGTTPVTTIVVDSGRDLNTSMSETCISRTPCTLRRAIVQARNLPDDQKPVLISFDIPQDPAEGYNASLDIWKIQMLSTSDASVLRRLNGQIIIDGSTQAGGRLTGPKIFLVGPGTGQKDGLIVGDVAGDDGQEIRGLGFQNFKTHIYMNTSNNLIEDNWFGLSDDGTQPYLRQNNPQDGSGNTGIAVMDSAKNNIIQNNVFLGLDGVSAVINGEQNTFAHNYVGTAADGSVPGKQTDPDLICTSEDWLGGGGISISGVVYGGTNHRIEDNIFAGLRQEIFAISTQPEAISVHGTYHLIQNNLIGVDKNGAKVGVCGRGIYLIGSPHDMQVFSNTVVDSGLSALSLNDVLYDAVTLRNNTVEKTTSWPEVEGNSKPEDAIQLGTSLPDPLELFKPAKVTSIQGPSVTGTSGNNSPCPNCTIEIYLDDTDAITEALQSLTVVAADANGDWTAVLPFELTPSQGLRTTSTTAKFNTIENISSGTTSGLSVLYTSTKYIFMPMLRR
jgi:hypothetical protein